MQGNGMTRGPLFVVSKFHYRRCFFYLKSLFNTNDFRQDIINILENDNEFNIDVLRKKIYEFEDGIHHRCFVYENFMFDIDRYCHFEESLKFININTKRSIKELIKFIKMARGKLDVIEIYFLKIWIDFYEEK